MVMMLSRGSVRHDRDGASVQGVLSTQYRADHRVFVIAVFSTQQQLAAWVTGYNYNSAVAAPPRLTSAGSGPS